LSQNWTQWLQLMREKEGSLYLPKFTLEYEAKLNDMLIHLGLAPAFADDADFSALAEPIVDGESVEGFQISEVKHKTFVDVNEVGTEAAAITSVGMRCLSESVSVERPFFMVVNRPFVSSIVD